MAGPRVEDARLKAVERVFRHFEKTRVTALPIRLTAFGVWVPTPFPVLAALLRATKTRGFFHPRLPGRGLVVDAGTGDGRVLASIAVFEPDLEIVGIESDARLFRLAADNLETLKENALVERPHRLRIGRGDYRAAATWESSGIRLEDVAFVVNYPDGNQDELERFVLEEMPRGVKLCLLTHDGGLRLQKLALSSKEPIFASDSSPWYWSVYSTTDFP